MFNGSRRADQVLSVAQTHLEMLQGVIQRMAENSRSCKFWSITTLSAVIVLMVRTGIPEHMLIAFAPVFLFGTLDVYYLTLEFRFRLAYDELLEKMRSGSYGPNDMYRIAPAGRPVAALWRCTRSLSIMLYYPFALAVILLVFVVLKVWGVDCLAAKPAIL